MTGRWELTEEQWELAEPVLRPRRREDNRSRPWHNTRAVLNGVPWILGSGAQWIEMAFEMSAVSNLPSPAPAVGPRGQAAFGRSVRGCDLRESQKGGFAVGPTKRGKGTKIVAIASGDGLPLAVSVASASPAECKLVEDVLAGCLLDELPARLIGDKACDSDPLDEKLATDYGVERASPNRCNRVADGTGWPPATRLHRRRWKTERIFAWIRTAAASSPDGNTVSKTSLASSLSHAS